MKKNRVLQRGLLCALLYTVNAWACTSPDGDTDNCYSPDKPTEMERSCSVDRSAMIELSPGVGCAQYTNSANPNQTYVQVYDKIIGLSGHTVDMDGTGFHKAYIWKATSVHGPNNLVQIYCAPLVCNYNPVSVSTA